MMAIDLNNKTFIIYITLLKTSLIIIYLAQKAEIVAFFNKKNYYSILIFRFCNIFLKKISFNITKAK